MSIILKYIYICISRCTVQVQCTSKRVIYTILGITYVPRDSESNWPDDWWTIEEKSMARDRGEKKRRKKEKVCAHAGKRSVEDLWRSLETASSRTLLDGRSWSVADFNGGFLRLANRTRHETPSSVSPLRDSTIRRFHREERRDIHRGELRDLI